MTNAPSIFVSSAAHQRRPCDRRGQLETPSPSTSGEAPQQPSTRLRNRQWWETPLSMITAEERKMPVSAGNLEQPHAPENTSAIRDNDTFSDTRNAKYSATPAKFSPAPSKPSVGQQISTEMFQKHQNYMGLPAITAHLNHTTSLPASDVIPPNNLIRKESWSLQDNLDFLNQHAGEGKKFMMQDQAIQPANHTSPASDCPTNQCELARSKPKSAIFTPEKNGLLTNITNPTSGQVIPQVPTDPYISFDQLAGTDTSLTTPQSASYQLRKNPKKRKRDSSPCSDNSVIDIDYSKLTVGQKVHFYLTKDQEGIKKFGGSIKSAAEKMNMKSIRSLTSLVEGKRAQISKLQEIAKHLPKELAKQVEEEAPQSGFKKT